MPRADFVPWWQSFPQILFLTEELLAPKRKGCSRCWLSAHKWGCTAFLFCVAVAIASPAQNFTTLATFNGTRNTLGVSPNGPLVQGLDGNLYGTTEHGGTCNWGCGTVFKITPSGALTTL